MNGSAEPFSEIKIKQCTVTLLGTAHVSKASAEQVRNTLEQNQFDAVAIELCASRHRVMTNPETVNELNLFDVIKSGKAAMIAMNLALGAYQQRIAQQFGIAPGAEMRAAIDYARKTDTPLWLIDRDVGITLRRVYANVSWWRRIYLLTGLLTSVVSRERIDEEEIENLKGSDVLESTFAQFAERAQDLYLPLINERDQYMSARLCQELEQNNHQKVLAVIGAGHLAGMNNYLESAHEIKPEPLIQTLNEIPVRRKWLKYLPWIIVALVFFGFALGFSRSPALGWELVLDWIVINGSLSALGALLAGGHLLTIIGAFVAAPITSLNPTIGAGMVTAAIELWVRKPNVGDFNRLRDDTTRLSGWWKNRVTRTLLVFLLSTLGSAAGTYIAGFRIFAKLN